MISKKSVSVLFPVFLIIAVVVLATGLHILYSLYSFSLPTLYLGVDACVGFCLDPTSSHFPFFQHSSEELGIKSTQATTKQVRGGSFKFVVSMGHLSRSSLFFFFPIQRGGGGNSGLLNTDIVPGLIRGSRHD